MRTGVICILSFRILERDFPMTNHGQVATAQRDYALRLHPLSRTWQSFESSDYHFPDFSFTGCLIAFTGPYKTRMLVI
jgi:hypothetical protein